MKNYAWPITSVNREDYLAFFEWYEQHSEVADAPLAVWGAGIRGSEFAAYFERKAKADVIYVDVNPDKQGGAINAYPIISPEKFFLSYSGKYKNVLISVENSHAIEEILKEKGFIKNENFFTVDTDLYKKYIEEYESCSDNCVLIMGDCEYSKVSIHDSDMSNLGEMIKAEMGSGVKVLAMHGMGIRSHYVVLNELLAKGIKPQTLILMVNFDTLTGKQHLLPRSQHSPIFEQLILRGSASTDLFRDYCEVTKERSNNIQSEMFTRNNATADENYRQKAMVYFRMNYMYRLDENVEGIVYLKKALEICNVEGIKAMLFIPPVNFELAEDVLGNSFYERYNANLNKLKQAISCYDYQMLDMSYSLPSTCFAEKNTPDETVNYDGRIALLKRFKEALHKGV